MPRRPAAPAVARPASAWAPALPDGEGLVLVVNAHAGGRHVAIADAVRSALPAAEIVMVGEETGDGGSGEDDVEVALRKAASRARVLGVAGGDGTVNTAAGIALEAGLPLAVAPAGTLNHFAVDVGLDSVDDMISAVRDGTAIAVDVGLIEGRDDEGERERAVFLNTASLVGYPEMVEIRERYEARFGKWPSMILALVRVLRDQPPARLLIDGRERKLWLVFVGNGHYSPDGFAPTYRERLDSGRLDVRLVDGTAPLARLRLVAAVLTGRLGRSRVYEERSVPSVRIDTGDGPLPFAKDGEVGGTVRHVELSKHPDRLVVYRPE